MRLLISQHNLGKWGAYYLYKKIVAFKPTKSKPFVLGLAAGSTSLEMYKQLIKLNQQKLISFKHVVTFNMNEYIGLPEDNPQSYHYYMQENLFKYIDILPENINILNGNATYLDYECKVYEEKIANLGGIELLFGGIGEDGHIAFNEPGSSLNSVTRVKTLHYNTRLANSRFFEHNVENTPNLALTMGIKTILNANNVVLLASGVNKAQAVAQAIEGAVSSMWPVTALQLHNKASIICDEYAAYNLQFKTVHYYQNLKDEYDDIEQAIATFEVT